ncbi:helix-turn-helix transcriptional regulator [Qipengyuania seohaensis]|uniref:helix-turn-helix transcriptional regulator n=1 Tax=Qipengyuania seohaensis TaxID=266951 RepID=UPI000C220A82
MTQFLSPKTVCERVAISRATLDRLVAAGNFPSPIRLTQRRLVYNQADVERWMAGRLGEA